MAYSLDPELAAAMAAVADRPNLGKIERGDWRTLRETVNASFAQWKALAPAYRDVETRTFSVTTRDGAAIELRWYAKKGAAPGSAVVYAHGGGMILANVDLYDPVVMPYVSTTGTPFLSVEYRLAPEARGDTPAQDTFAALAWLRDHAAELGVDPARIAIMGDSGGGGVAAGTAILARDRKVPLARQILIYPMLDDRNLTPIPEVEPFATWTYDNNFTGWSALLGDDLGKETVPPSAAPSRLKDFTGLAPAYIEVGELDIFRDESIAYAQGLAAARISIELHVHPNAPHGYDRLGAGSQVAARAMADRMRVIRSL
jgi:acetyl esterase/lipase